MSSRYSASKNVVSYDDVLTSGLIHHTTDERPATISLINTDKLGFCVNFDAAILRI